MRALHVTRGRSLELTTRSVTDRPGRECLISVHLAGICGTDLELLEGYADFTGTPGHEFVGVVEEAPSADAWWVGRRVVGEINAGCGDCRFCRTGIQEHCERRTVLGIRGRPGAFADYLTLPAANLHEVPPAVDDLRAVFVEPVAAACRILEQVDVGPSTRVAVVGDGRMGLVTGPVLRSAGARVIVIGRHDEKLAVARALGLETLRDTEAAGWQRTQDLVVDVTGRPSGLDLALSLVRPRGTVVLKSTFHGTVTWTPWPTIVDEIALVGSRCGPFRPALDLLASERIDVMPLVAGIHPLADFARAFDRARRELKIVLTMEADS